jgi:hypothetical protein
MHFTYLLVVAHHRRHMYKATVKILIRPNRLLESSCTKYLTFSLCHSTYSYYIRTTNCTVLAVREWFLFQMCHPGRGWRKEGVIMSLLYIYNADTAVNTRNACDYSQLGDQLMSVSRELQAPETPRDLTYFIAYSLIFLF